MVQGITPRLYQSSRGLDLNLELGPDTVHVGLYQTERFKSFFILKLCLFDQYCIPEIHDNVRSNNFREVKGENFDGEVHMDLKFLGVIIIYLTDKTM